MKETNMKLWYQAPAYEWTEALPLGNGRLGAMVFGGADHERIALNEDTLWSGYPKDTNNPSAAQYLPHARTLARQKRFGELERWIEEHMQGDYTESFLPLGDLHLDFPGIDSANIRSYRRCLFLDTAIAQTEFTCGGIAYRRTVFVSHPAQVMVIRLTADRPNSISVRVRLSSPLHSHCRTDGSLLMIEGLAPSHVEPPYLPCDNPVVYEEEDARKGMRFTCGVQAQTRGGQIRTCNDTLEIQHADEVLLFLAAHTSFNGYDRQPYLEGKDCTAAVLRDLDSAAASSFEDLLQTHIQDHSALFGRVNFCLAPDAADTLPTDQRLLRQFEGEEDPHLYELLFQYGRYLMIAGSRPGTQATTLQGIWNQDLRPAWSSNYTLNINTEMNYWPAEPCNLSELHEPLFALIQELRHTGTRTAQLHYNAAGVATHHNTDIWRLSNPVGRQEKGSVGYAYWCMSFGWLCRHLYEHYEYTLDKSFLEKQVYPTLRDAAVFYLDNLQINAHGHAVLTPSTSPENSFVYEGQAYKVDETTTMTTAIIREVFEELQTCCRILNREDPLLARVEEMGKLLVPYRISGDGTLMEWYGEYADAVPDHRHISHLYGLYPANQISFSKTPELAAACRATLQKRGDDGTGWSLGWKVSTWARLEDGEHALRLLRRQLQPEAAAIDNCSTVKCSDGGGGTYPNLFDACPPFQIDGNFAATAGIGQMLLQSQPGELRLLPALPRAWQTCRVSGLRAMGNLTISLDVENGRLQCAEIEAGTPCVPQVTVTYAGRQRDIALTPGRKVKLDSWT